MWLSPPKQKAENIHYGLFRNKKARQWSMASKSIIYTILYIHIKLSRSFNSLHSKCYKFSEPVLLHLVAAYCKPFLLYGMEAVSPTKSELNYLEYTYSSAHALSSVCEIFKVFHSGVAM